MQIIEDAKNAENYLTNYKVFKGTPTHPISKDCKHYFSEFWENFSGVKGFTIEVSAIEYTTVNKILTN